MALRHCATLYVSYVLRCSIMCCILVESQHSCFRIRWNYIVWVTVKELQQVKEHVVILVLKGCASIYNQESLKAPQNRNCLKKSGLNLIWSMSPIRPYFYLNYIWIIACVGEQQMVICWFPTSRTRRRENQTVCPEWFKVKVWSMFFTLHHVYVKHFS